MSDFDCEATATLGAAESKLDRVRMSVWVRRDLYNQVLEVIHEEDTTITEFIKSALKDRVKRHKQGDL